MKKILQEIVIYSVSLYTTSLIIPGLIIEKHLATYVIGGIFLIVGETILKPILRIISLPLNIITLGLSSSLVNVATFYLITVIFPKIKISAFQFKGVTFYGVVIPDFFVSLFLSYVLISATIYIISTLLRWFFLK